jgi:hypothetical protein
MGGEARNRARLLAGLLGDVERHGCSLLGTDQVVARLREDWPAVKQANPLAGAELVEGTTFTLPMGGRAMPA